jgi:peroxiredoxin family protein
MVGVLPGVTSLATTMMKHEIEKLDFPDIHEFIQMISDAGGKLYSCKMSMDMMHLAKEDLCEEVIDVVGAMEFMEMSEDAQIIFV